FGEGGEIGSRLFAREETVADTGLEGVGVGGVRDAVAAGIGLQGGRLPETWAEISDSSTSSFAVK
ncbi:MAG: hypothetical protein ACREIU_14220, partial [Planctomycetota bacterium]